MVNPFERLVRSVVDYAIFMLDPQGRITSWNVGAERIKGYREDEVLGKPLSIFYTEEDRSAGLAERNLEEARRNGSFTAEDWRVRRDGTRFWASVVIDAIYDEQCQLIGFAKITRDRTDEHHAFEARVQAERDDRLQKTLAADHALLLLDPEGRITCYSPPASQSDGPDSPTDWVAPIGQRFSHCFFHDSHFDPGERLLALSREDGRHQHEHWWLRRDGSRFWAHVIIDAVRDTAGDISGFAVIVRDASDRQQTLQQLEASRAQLRQAQKLEAIGQLTGGIAHDFNNLLTGIIGSLELLRRRRQSGHDADIDRLIATAESSARRAASLTHGLLTFARRQSRALTMAPVDINVMVRELGEIVRRTLGKHIRVDQLLDDACGSALTDRNQLETALLNLLINARDAMADGGVVCIESKAVRLAPGELPADATVSEGHYVRLTVRDTGCGMSPEVLRQATEPFFTTKPVGQGTGLGLSMIHGFVRQNGGFVRLESEVGVGTQVHLYLPAARQGPVETDATPATAPVGQGEVVLVVEDEPAVRSLIVEVLQELNYRYIEADHAQAALPLLQSPGTRIDLLISDLTLPGISGRELVEHGRQLRPSLKVLFITGYDALDPDASDALLDGTALLRKPFALTDLATRIRSLLTPSYGPDPASTLPRA